MEEALVMMTPHWYEQREQPHWSSATSPSIQITVLRCKHLPVLAMGHLPNQFTAKRMKTVCVMSRLLDQILFPLLKFQIKRIILLCIFIHIHWTQHNNRREKYEEHFFFLTRQFYCFFLFQKSFMCFCIVLCEQSTTHYNTLFK